MKAELAKLLVTILIYKHVVYIATSVPRNMYDILCERQTNDKKVIPT